jgi:hypothetical protein
MSDKPPVGLIPKKISLEDRLNLINQAVARYITADYQIPTIEWVEERNDPITELEYGNCKSD